MQLTGDRFTSETAVFGNDLATLPDFPAEIRAPAGSLPGVSGFQVHFADHDILTPGDQPSVLVAMNPAALKVNVGDLAKGGTIIANTDAFNDRNLQKAGYESNPLEDGSLGDFHVHPVGAFVDDGRGAEGNRGRDVARGRALEELLRAGPHVVALPPADRGDARVHRVEVREAPRDRRGQHEGVQGRVELRRDVGGLRELVRDRARADRPGDLPADLGQYGPDLRPRRSEQALRPAALPRRLPDHAGLGRSRAARGAEAVRGSDLPGRGRDRGVGGRTRRGVRRRARRDDVGRPRDRPQVRDGGPGGDARAAARHRRRAACRDRRRECPRSPSRPTS